VVTVFAVAAIEALLAGKTICIYFITPF
jgi:hypothetical protein